jgi:hypothetical protein
MSAQKSPSTKGGGGIPTKFLKAHQVIGLKPAKKNMDEALEIYPHQILGRNPYHNNPNHINLGIMYENAGDKVPCELFRVSHTTDTSI